MMHRTIQRGFTLLISVILSTVVLTVGLALLDVAYKQVILASTAKQSQAAFYNADSALECALYYDQKFNAFDFTTPAPAASLTCSSTPVTNYSTNADAVKRITIFTIPCPVSGVYATSTIYKYANGATSLYADGFNTCTATDPRRIERGLKATYGVASVASSGSATYLIIAGGGGGGTGGGGNTNGGGGGGAGGVVSNSATLASGTYTITVGTGGSGAPANSSNGSNGGNSSISTIGTAVGGGGGGSVGAGGTGSLGGSGGGTNAALVGGGAGTPTQGNAGGSSNGSGTGGGGGGYNSAGSAGSNSASAPNGNGGTGLSSSISGASVDYASGGGAGWATGGAGRAGTGGGSSAGNGGSGGAGTSAPANRGGGGGGSAFTVAGGNGGSGVVILSFPTGSLGLVSATGTFVKTVVGGNDIYTYTGNGTFVVP